MSLRIRDKTGTNIVGATLLSLVVIGAAVIMATVPKWGKTPRLRDYVLLYAIIIGVPLFPVAAVIVLAWHARKFGRGTLVITSMPLQLGGPLVGHIEINRRLENVTGFRVNLEFVKFVTRTRSISEQILWKDELLLNGEEVLVRAEDTIVPVNFTIPDVPAAGGGPLGTYCRWRITGEALPDKGAHFSTEIQLPREVLPTGR